MNLSEDEREGLELMEAFTYACAWLRGTFSEKR